MPRAIGYGRNLVALLEIVEDIQPCTRERLHGQQGDLTLGEVSIYLGRAVRYGLADIRADGQYITKAGWRDVVGVTKDKEKENGNT
jgi:hypothetical protein